MSITHETRSAIAQAIGQVFSALDRTIPDEELEHIAEQLERNLETAGYMVIPISEFGFPVPDEPNP